MIAVDTSALLAIVFDEELAEVCKTALSRQSAYVISAGTLAEAMIVAGRRGVTDKLLRLTDALHFEVIPVTAASASRMAAAYGRWGKGNHPARLNLGDCFAYDVAKEHNCPLLFVGDDFAQTDIKSAL